MLLTIEKVLILKSVSIFSSVPEAIEDCTLLCVDGESLYELMSGNKEVTRGIIHVLCDYARENLARAGK